MIPKIKSLIYPLLFTQPTFFTWYNTKLLSKTYDIDIQNDKYNISGYYKFNSRYNDKHTLANKGYDEITSKLKIIYEEDVYCEKINQKLICLINDIHPYHITNNHILLKNNECITFNELDNNLLKLIFINNYGENFKIDLF